MKELIIIAVKILDPISFVLAFVIVLFGSKRSIILISATVTAVAVETFLTSSQITRTWGQSIIPGFLASLIHAGVSFWIVGMAREKKAKTSIKSGK